MIALAEIDEDKATTALHRMFARHDGHGSGARLLAHFTGAKEATTEQLIASLPGIGNLLGVLTSAALGERGAASVPAVHAALRALPFPAREEADHWWQDESTKYRLMQALGHAGPAAAPATPTLLAVLADEEIYRDTRHQAEVTLQAIGTPETADTIAAEVRRRADLVAHGVNDESDQSNENEDRNGFGLLLDVLLGMPSAALAASREVGPALAAVRRRFGTGIRTYEEDGEILEYTVHEVELADCIDEKVAKQIAEQVER
ncbi:hypothetical protein [Embleya sp. AB8]|uniref:hypothetical protein n=1 Tax=Embleya sp. AB8 TaxID=3156304 RepID=UPI003C776E5D